MTYVWRFLLYNNLALFFSNQNIATWYTSMTHVNALTTIDWKGIQVRAVLAVYLHI